MQPIHGIDLIDFKHQICLLLVRISYLGRYIYGSRKAFLRTDLSEEDACTASRIYVFILY